MDGIPTDLIPLPTAPWEERPVALPLDAEECRTAIWMTRGNVTEAAKLVKVSSNRLRTFIQKSPYLSAELQEANDQLVDIAQDIVFEALTDEEDKSRKDTMARFVLGSQGRSRGWGSAAGGGVNIKNSTGGTILVQWQDGTTFGEGSPSVPEPEMSGPERVPQMAPDRLITEKHQLTVEHDASEEVA